jgi:hypothetical protein
MAPNAMSGSRASLQLGQYTSHPTVALALVPHFSSAFSPENSTKSRQTRLFSATGYETHDDLTFAPTDHPMMTALTHGNLQIGAIGFRTLLGTTEICLSVAGTPDPGLLR